MLQSLTVAQTTDQDVYKRYIDEIKRDLIGYAEEQAEANAFERSGIDKLRNKIGRR